MIKFDVISIVGVVLLFVFFIYQMYFYFCRLLIVNNKKFQVDKDQISSCFSGKVSVIIVAENEIYQLRASLDLILEQDYHDFEVIVVNYGSNDETELIFEDLYSKYPNLYTTFLPASSDTGFNKKKLALTLGAKAAKGDFLIFTEYYALPNSTQWISKMVDSIAEETEIVLGISNINTNNLFFNKLARYNNLFFSLEYISAALNKAPYTGTYRNLGLKKTTFFNQKGFANSLKNIPNSEDLFVNQIVKENNVSVCLDIDGVTLANYDSFSQWRRILKNLSLAKFFFTNYSSFVFSFEKASRVLIYILSIVLIIYSSINTFFIPLIVSVLLLLLKIIANYYIVNKTSAIFNNGKFKYSLPFVDFIEAIYCVRFKTRKKI